MARKLRIEYPGAVYHVMSRGINRQDIFFENQDKNFFLSLIPRAKNKYGLLVHAYVLMDNHYHMLIETPHGNLSKVMKWINVTYSRYFNFHHKREGHLFQGRYKDKLVSKDNYMLQASLYIHLNPFKAGIENIIGKYPYSSLKDYFETQSKLNITTETILGMLSENKEEALKEYKKMLQTESTKEKSSFEIAELIYGSKEFIKEIISKVETIKNKETKNIRKLSLPQLSPEEIIDIVCLELGTTKENLLKKDALNRQAQKISIYMIRNYSSLTNKQTGELFGISNSGVTQCCFRLEKQLIKDNNLKNLLIEVKEKLESQLC